MQEEGGAANTDLRVNLYHWAGLPSAKLLSVDPSCLQVHAFLRFAGIPYTAIDSEPDVSSTITLNSEPHVVGSQSIISYFTEMGYNIDSHLTGTQLSELMAYRLLVEDSLIYLHLQVWWTYPNANKVSSYFQTKCHFLLKLIGANRYRQQMQTFVNARQIPEELLKEKADRIFNILSTKLGSQAYFFGERPTTLDAAVFGVLATILWVDVPAPILREILMKYPNLVHLCSRILKKYMGEEPITINTEPASYYLKQKEAETANPQQMEEKMVKWGNHIAITAAAALLAIFSIMNNSMVQRWLTSKPTPALQHREEEEFDEDTTAIEEEVEDDDEYDIEEFDDDDDDVEDFDFDFDE